MFVGYYLGYAFLRINSVIEKVGFVLGALIVMGVLVYLATRYMKKKKIQTNEPELAIDLQKTVMVFGVFDTLHEGHRFFIQEAQNLGNTLVAVIARDSIVAAYKGRKPDQNERVRLETLQKEYPEVTVVLGDETENSWGVIKQYQPDIIALGYDQEKLREALGVTIPTLPFPTMLVTINDHRGDELHSSLLRNK
jgi:cytidyltransferase-like protein